MLGLLQITNGTELYFSLQSPQFDGLVARHRMLPDENVVADLNIKEIQLHRIAGVYVGVVAEEPSPQQECVILMDRTVQYGFITCQPFHAIVGADATLQFEHFRIGHEFWSAPLGASLEFIHIICIASLFIRFVYQTVFLMIN